MPVYSTLLSQLKYWKLLFFHRVSTVDLTFFKATASTHNKSNYISTVGTL